MFKSTVVLSLAILLTACGSTDPAKAKANDEEFAKLKNDKNMVCEYTATTGSHRKKRTCMSRELSDEVRRRNQEALRSQESKGQPSAGVSTGY